MRNSAALLVEPILLILVSLADEPKHGYSIMKDIESLTGWTMRPGTLYGALSRMDERGWIDEQDSEDYRRRPYLLTAAGRAELDRQLALMSNLTSAALKRTRSSRAAQRRA